MWVGPQPTLITTAQDGSTQELASLRISLRISLLFTATVVKKIAIWETDFFFLNKFTANQITNETRITVAGKHVISQLQ